MEVENYTRLLELAESDLQTVKTNLKEREDAADAEEDLSRYNFKLNSNYTSLSKYVEKVQNIQQKAPE